MWPHGSSVLDPPPDGLEFTNDELWQADPADNTPEKLEAAIERWDSLYR